MKHEAYLQGRGEGAEGGGTLYLLLFFLGPRILTVVVR